MTLPTILMSGVMPTEELNRHPAIRVAATLQKPFIPDELLGIVENLLGNSDQPSQPRLHPL
jgi:hypothetical protein